MTEAAINLERLFKIRLIVGRFGEMDLARWWNTSGQLGRLGAAAVRRGFPRTHPFARARSVFAVADHRCREIFDPPECVTLWHLPEAIEGEFESRWEHWLDAASEWQAFFEKLEKLENGDLKGILQTFGVVTDSEIDASSRLRRSAEGRAVPLLEPFLGTDREIALLALGFTRGEIGSPTVPYASLGTK